MDPFVSLESSFIKVSYFLLTCTCSLPHVSDHFEVVAISRVWRDFRVELHPSRQGELLFLSFFAQNPTTTWLAREESEMVGLSTNRRQLFDSSDQLRMVSYRMTVCGLWDSKTYPVTRSPCFLRSNLLRQPPEITSQKTSIHFLFFHFFNQPLASVVSIHLLT
jgi:hypothetical protein